MNVSLILSLNLDFSSCDNLVGFLNPLTYVILRVHRVLQIDKDDYEKDKVVGLCTG